MIFNVPGHIDMIRRGIKTQTRRVNRGIYQVGKDYAVQRKRGVKAEDDIRILINALFLEMTGPGFILPPHIVISSHDAMAEGSYTSSEYELEFKRAYPKWDGQERWAFCFHVIGVQKC